VTVMYAICRDSCVYNVPDWTLWTFIIMLSTFYEYLGSGYSLTYAV